ncbi:MAG: hypothetical protein Alpg2KO_31550 [Alphaproteobacteria bacterium]
MTAPYKLTSRAIIGEYFARLAQNPTPWVEAVSNLFTSDQESETYAFLGQVPQMEEWKGERKLAGLSEYDFTIKNKEFSAGIEIGVNELRRDKSGQALIRIRELADRVNTHWAKLLSELIETGSSVTCYDGQFFFDTDHSEGKSGTQSNDIEHTVVSATTPTAAEMEKAITASVQQLLGFKDDQGEPVSEGARQFLVMVPQPFFEAANRALRSARLIDSGSARDNLLVDMDGYSIGLAVNQRLSWTSKFATFRTDGSVKPLIRQEEVEPMPVAIAEGSETEKRHKRHEYFVDAIRNAGFGDWRGACLTTLTT